MAAVYDGEIDVPETAIQIIDDAVLASMSPTMILYTVENSLLIANLYLTLIELSLVTIGKSITAYGASNWTRTARTSCHYSSRRVHKVILPKGLSSHNKNSL